MNESALPTTASQQLVEERLAVCGSLKQENESLKAQLDWFKRHLLGQKSDGNLVYDSYCNNRDDIILAQCWVHARRYFNQNKRNRLRRVRRWLSLAIFIKRGCHSG